MSEHTEPELPDTPEGMAEWVDNLTFHPDRPVTAVPPRAGDDEDALVPRSVRLPQRLDAELAAIAARRGLAKSDLIRGYLLAAVAADAAQGGEDVMIPLSAALRALSGLPHLPRSA